MWGGYHLACPSAAFPANYTNLLTDPVYVPSLLSLCPPVKFKIFKNTNTTHTHTYVYCTRRYPVGAKPDSLLKVADLFKMHRYTYQGTPYDLGAAGNLAAGPFGSPDRWSGGDGSPGGDFKGSWERPIGLCVLFCSISVVLPFSSFCVSRPSVFSLFLSSPL